MTSLDRYAYLSDDTGAYDEASGDWTIGRIELGETVELNILAKVYSTVSSNTAQVTESLSQDPDSIPENDDGDQDEDDEFSIPIRRCGSCR